MTTSPGTQVRPLAETAKHGARLLPPARYRHPGDVIRLIIAGLVLAGSAGGYRRHSCHLCRSQRCRRGCSGACRPGGPGAGRGGAGGSCHRGRRRSGRNVALPPVPAAGRPGRCRRSGERRGDRDHSARGRTAAPRSGGRCRPVVVAYRRVAGGPRASCRRRGRHGRRRAVAQPPVAARCLGHLVACRRGGAGHRHRLAGGSALGVRRRGNGRGRCAGLVRSARPAHRPREDRGGAGLGGPAGDRRRAGRGRGEGLAAVRRGRRGRDSRCSSRSSAPISGTPTCCTAPTGSSGCARSAIPGPPPRSSRRSSIRRSPRSWRSGPGWRCPPSGR